MTPRRGQPAARPAPLHLHVGPTKPLTHDGVAPELRHLPGPHGAEQRLPDLHLEHLAHDDLHGDAGLPAVIDHRPLEVVLQRLEVEGDLPQRKSSVQGRHVWSEPSVPSPTPNPLCHRARTWG